MAWTVHEALLGFSRALQVAGLNITTDREMSFISAISATGMEQRQKVYWAARCTLTSSPEDVMRFDQIFAGWFGGTSMDAVTIQPPPLPTKDLPQLLDDDSLDNEQQKSRQEMQTTSSRKEVLRQRDFAEINAAERERLQQMFAALKPQFPIRKSRTPIAAHRGRIDRTAILRQQWRNMGELTSVPRRRKYFRYRRVVLLLDISGSMNPYIEANMRLAHTVCQAAPDLVEAFTLGTRLTRVTRALRSYEVDHALGTTGALVPDWSGGTRLGDMLGEFLRGWGRRGTARGAVTVVFSDGWEQKGFDALAKEMFYLQNLSHRVIWVSPHRGKEGYRPVQKGISAALPYVDDFVAGHSLATFAELLDLISRA